MLTETCDHGGVFLQTFIMVDRPSTAPTSYSGNIRPASARVPLPTLEQYVFTERLGAGTYATVYKAFKKVIYLTLV